jgi:PQQ enzyme repeat/PQQ-like domain
MNHRFSEGAHLKADEYRFGGKQPMNPPLKKTVRRRLGPAGIFLSFIVFILLFGIMKAGTSDMASKKGPEHYDWLQFNFDARHSGFNDRESKISSANVSRLQPLFRVRLPAIVDGAPASLSSVKTAGGVKDLLFLTTKAGHLLALDAETGKQIWIKQNPAGSCRINNGYEPCYTTSSPAIDPNREFVYSYGLDGRVHKYLVGDGREITGSGWPQLATLKSFDEKGSSALSIAKARNGRHYLYAANSGYWGDRGDYQGHITTIDLANGHQKVFNANCSDQAVHFLQEPAKPDCPSRRSAIWARAGVVYDAATDRIYAATGNGPFRPARHNWGDTVFSLYPDGSGKNGDPLDSFTPADYQELEDRDLDLGSTGPAILPMPKNSIVRHLALQGGKGRKLRLVNLDNLSGNSGPGHTGGQVGQVIDVPQGGMIFTAPAVWINPGEDRTWVFVATSEGISGIRLQPDAKGNPHLQLQWKSDAGGTSPIIANGLLYYAGSHGLRALNPKTGKVLWSSREIGRIHWQSPIIVNGLLYITDENGNLNAFGLGASK